jgi:hypothetical protein
MTEGTGGAGARVAFVHDFLVHVRGAERLFIAPCDPFPAADLFIAVHDERGTEGRFAARDVRTSAVPSLRRSSRTFRTLPPLYPSAMESLDLRGDDFVRSSSSAWAHGVVPPGAAVHVGSGSRLLNRDRGVQRSAHPLPAGGPTGPSPRREPRRPAGLAWQA